MMASNILSPPALLRIVEASIKQSTGSATLESRPQTLQNPYDAIALLVHSCMLSVGFRLIGLGEDDKLGV